MFNQLNPPIKKKTSAMKIFKTNNYYFSVTINPNNTITIATEYERDRNGKWIKHHSQPFESTAVVNGFGGVDRFIAKCKDVDNLDEFIEHLNRENTKSKKTLTH